MEFGKWQWQETTEPITDRHILFWAAELWGISIYQPPWPILLFRPPDLDLFEPIINNYNDSGIFPEW